VRFADVIAELQAIAALTPDLVTSPEGAAISAACERAEAVLVALRSQFLEEVILAERPPSAAAVR